MNFRPELARAVMYGQKTVTRRLVREDNPRSPWHPDRALKLEGKRVAIQPGRGKPAIGYATVVDVQRELFIPILSIDAQEAWREGFGGVEEFFAVWRELHGDHLEAEYDVWRIQLRVSPEEQVCRHCGGVGECSCDALALMGAQEAT